MSAITDLEREIFQKVAQLNQLRKCVESVPVRNYEFSTLDGKTTLLDLFAG